MEYTSLGQFVFALLFVLGLIGVTALIGKKVLVEKKWLKGLQPQGRIKVEETVYIDSKHKLVLVKRDDKEHLLLVGAQHALVVEADVRKENHA